MAPLESGEHDVTLNGVRLHYSVRGRGPVLIAHSGGPGWDARSWDTAAGIDSFVTLVVLHPRGSGLSAAPADGRYALADYAADLDALRRHLGVSKPIVMGWSHGGMVAQQYASQYPEGLSKLVLYSTSARFGSGIPDPQAVFGALMVHQQQPWFTDSMAALQDWWAGRFKTDAEATGLLARALKFYFRTLDGEAERYLQRCMQWPVHIAPLLTFMGSEATAMDLRRGLAAVRVPGLVIAGRHDFVTPVAMSQEIASCLPGAQLEVFNDAGHFAHVEEPAHFHQRLRRFVLDEPAA
ncbi:alpha/beta fold hydrolase [Marinobacterium rhizophilum]|uniref:Alpha/beta hydrolase n=1 Tax=Marinobacterium rhizophilum TaxID=420402 RepID=A0ABY5HIH8_9GAMM|nr:alpha/beta hydrolase [Marinobacterium rhizophilum]UTW12068.1 alpha/beta hydrolase [Marinobacterium rhizophilum]